MVFRGVGAMSSSVISVTSFLEISRHHQRKRRDIPPSPFFDTSFPNPCREQTNPLPIRRLYSRFLPVVDFSGVLSFFLGEEMATLLSGKMKRKDWEEVSDEFSDFSLSSPARKIRRLVRKFSLFPLFVGFL